MPPVKPMLAGLVEGIPDGMRCEPKFDGFLLRISRQRGRSSFVSKVTDPLGSESPGEGAVEFSISCEEQPVPQK